MDIRPTGRPAPSSARRDGNALRLSRVLPVGLVVVGIVFQLVTPAQLTGTPFFVAAPLTAAPLYSWGATLAFGAAGLVSAALLHLVAGSIWESTAALDLATELAAIAFATAMAALLNRVVHRAQEQLAAARGVAEAAQRAVLPTPPERIGGLRLASHYEAAQRDALIGGDLFAARATPYGARLVIGDVRGKGLGAIETVSVILGAFWEAVDRSATLAELSGSLEHALAREAMGRSGFADAEGFATCLLVEVPADSRVLRTLNLGHPPPLLLLPDGDVADLAPRAFGVPLGLSDLSPSPPVPDEWEFPAGATLLLYTDGLSEARDGDGTFYDPASRLKGPVFSSPARLLATIVGDVKRFTGGRATDDMALLAAHRPRGRAPRT
ncbi:PP2C family protein-serine/threonine phosphatase [Streptomyces sp. NPDC094032]|uniref:PP2C family protein-serine/threonine phosphatase n=1 Tax=Streptomyces sp. NPDC094032 TaxID=3155308 RepID=UPI003330806B